MIIENAGLVLEGGGMRGLYTAGVLESFLDIGIEFKYIVGVSAGACNAASYISKQKGRNKIVNTAFVKDWRYLSLRNLFKVKSLFGMDFIFDEIPKKLVPFDYESFLKSHTAFKIGATDCNTGKGVYFDKSEMDDKFSALRASCSLPLASPIVSFRGYELLDGGVSDPIPVYKSIADGNNKNVIILTRNKGYKKEQLKFVGVYKAKYGQYPKLLETIRNRHNNYNAALDFIEKQEEQGNAVVIRPSKLLKADRFEKDPAKLLELYQNGYDDGRDAIEKIRSLIKEDVCG
jgi:predicted patatin/cPLA2 family phospholipase